MSKIRADKIEYKESNFVVELSQSAIKEEIIAEDNEIVKQEQLVKNRIQNLIDEASNQAQDIISSAQKEAADIINEAKAKAEEILQNANIEANNQAEDIISSAQEKIENERIEQAKLGYEEGHKDGQEKIQEELEDKIKAFDKYCNIQLDVKNKILKSLKKDIAEIISNVSRKIIHKEINPEVLESIVKKTILLLEKKEGINVIVSEKYAKLFLELQNKKLGEDEEFSLENLKSYDNFNLSYNPKISL